MTKKQMTKFYAYTSNDDGRTFYATTQRAAKIEASKRLRCKNAIIYLCEWHSCGEVWVKLPVAFLAKSGKVNRWFPM